MSARSGIQWTEATWNPTTGCTKVSPGCANCYIERTPPFRIAGRRFEKGHIPLQFHEDRLDAPLRWRKPRRVFVNSLSDLFHEDVPDAFIERVFSVMGLAERHTFQVLTKRPERMLSWFRARRFDVKGAAILQTESGTCHYALPWPLPNVWFGCSVENQHFADERIPLLLQTPAAIRFVSAEPLLGPVDISRWMTGCRSQHGNGECVACSQGNRLPSLSWVIVGGESGPHARPCRVQWVRDVVAQCRAAGVPVFVKQLGSRPEGDPRPPERRDSVTGARILTVMQAIEISDRKGGNPAEWPEDLRVRQYPEVRT